MRKKEYSMEVLATRRSCETPKSKKGKRPSINQRKKERPWNPEKAQKVVEQRLRGTLRKHSPFGTTKPRIESAR